MMSLAGLKGFIFSGVHVEKMLSDGEYGLPQIRTPGPYILRRHLEDYGINIEIVDFIESFTSKDFDKLKKYIKNADFFGISCTFLPLETYGKLCKFLKNNFPFIPIITGGMKFISEKYAEPDYIVYNYGENAIIKVLEHHFLNKDLDYKILGKKCKFINATHAYISVPKADYSYKYKLEDHYADFETGVLEINRGCIFKCKFCAFPFVGMKGDNSQKSIDKIVDALNHNYELFGITTYILSNETCNDKTENLKKLVEIQEKINFTAVFSGFLRLDLMWSYPEQLDLLLKANFVGHHYGIETLNLQAGKAIGKGKQTEIAKEYLLYVRDRYKEAGVPLVTQVTLITGLPYETPNDCYETNEWFATHLPECKVYWYPLTIHDSHSIATSDFTYNAEKYGYVLPNTGEIEVKWDGHEYTEKTVNWKNQYWTFVHALKFAKQLNEENLKLKIKNPWAIASKYITAKQRANNIKLYIKKRLNNLEKSCRKC